jgi:hypothetical protein
MRFVYEIIFLQFFASATTTPPAPIPGATFEQVLVGKSFEKPGFMAETPTTDQSTTSRMASREPESIILQRPMRTVEIESSTGRVFESFNDAFYQRVGAELAAKLQEQIKLDSTKQAAIYTPRVDEALTETTQVGALPLGPILHRGESTIVFSIIGDDTKLIKYQVQDEKLNSSVHPLLIDAWYTQEANEIEVSPKVLAISPPALLCKKQQGRCSFGMSAQNYESCQKRQCTVRYMVMERLLGVSLLHMKRYMEIDVGTSIDLGIQIIETLRDLHTKSKIVHGDIHLGNIMVEQVDQEYVQARLIDFGRAFRYRQDLSLSPVYRPGAWYHRNCSRWQIEGYTWSARDDIARAIQVIAQLMNPLAEYIEYELNVVKSFQLLKWKTVGFWFKTDELNPIEAMTHISPEAKKIIKHSLNSLLKLMQGLELNDSIPYQTIIDLLEIAGDALSRKDQIPNKEQTVVQEIVEQVAASTTIPEPVGGIE